MRLKDGNTNITIAGIWNPAILNPHWLAANIFDVAEGQNEPVQIEFAPVGGVPPRFTLRGTMFIPSRERLIVQPAQVNDNSLDAVEAAAKRILERLPHTPLIGIGCNFSFVEEAPGPEQLEPFSRGVFDLAALSFEFEITERSTTSALAFDGHILNLTQTLQNNQVTIDFNFHYASGSAIEAAARLRSPNGIFRQNFYKARGVLHELYHFELQPEEVQQ